MISSKDYKDYKNSIIFAPNGSGKTRLSVELYNKSNPDKTFLFTAKKINELIYVDSTKIYVGFSAKYEKENSIINEKMEKNNFFKNYLSKFYNCTDSRKLKKISYYFYKKDIKNTKSNIFAIESLCLDNYNISNNYDIKDLIELDKNIDIEIVQFIEMLENLKEKDFDDIHNNDENFEIYPDNIFDSINTLYEYSIDNKINKCLLCGKIDDEIISIIYNNIKKYKKYEQADIYDKINYFYKKIENSKCNSIKDKIKELILYKNRVEENCKKIDNYFLNYEIDNENLYQKIKKYNENQENIEKLRIKNDEAQKYEDLIKTELNNLIYFPSNKEVKFKDGKLYFYCDDIELNIQESLSDSETRRVALAVMKAEIKYNNINYVILDDPIDSCDDYYINVASNYISNLISDERTTYFTVMTHMYNFAYLLCKSIQQQHRITHFDFYFYYQNPSYKYQSKNNNNLLMHSKISIKDVINSNKNEIIILNELIQSNRNGDSELLIFVFLCLFPTLRSVYKDINESIQKVDYIKNDQNEHYDKNMVSELFGKLDDCYIHYDEIEISADEIVNAYNIITGSSI